MLEAEKLHGHLIGQQGSRRSLNTPALVLDLEMLDRNIAEIHLADAIELMTRRSRPSLSQDRSPKNPY